MLWGVVKDDLMRMFSAFQDGNLPIFHLNYGTIILLPKKENAIQIQQYRPICLLNVSFKIFTKVGTNQIVQIVESIIRPTQTAFMPGRHILEGVVILHETIHELHRKKMDGICDILAQGLIGLIGYSYQQGIPSFPEAHLKRTPG
jgi:hypothetical protein